jgi:hypothetical protein
MAQASQNCRPITYESVSPCYNADDSRLGAAPGRLTPQHFFPKEPKMANSKKSLLAIITLAALAASAAIVLTVNSQAFAAEKQANKLAKVLIGTWAFAGPPGEAKDPPAKGARLKFITDKCWTVTQADPDTGLVAFHHGGTFTLDENKYSESIVYANESTKELIGKTLHFKVKVEGDTLTQEGIDNTYNEVWKRVK